MRFNGKLLAILLIIMNGHLTAQGQYYYRKTGAGRSVISRIDPGTGLSEDIVRNIPGIACFMTPDQDKMICEYDGNLYLTENGHWDAHAPIFRMSDDETVMSILDASMAQKIFINLQDADFLPTRTLAIDRNTGNPVDTKYGMVKFNFDKPFLSKNEKTIYSLASDPNGIFFNQFDMHGNLIAERIKCGGLGPFDNFITSPEDARAGMCAVSFEYTPEFTTLHYVLCDPENKTAYAPIRFPWKSKALLSVDGNEMIIGKVKYLYGNHAIHGECWSGDIYVFDSINGILKQRVRIPDVADILLFKDHPAELYYFGIDEPSQARTVNLESNQADSSVLAMMSTDLADFYRKGWISGTDIFDKYMANLNAIIRCASCGKRDETLFEMRHYLREIKADSGIALQVNAYYSMKINAEYILSRLLKN